VIVGIGLDLVKRSRIEAALARHGDRFTHRIFTPDEQAYAGPKRHSALHYAGMWAVKESLVKALGTGFSEGIGWRDVAVGHDRRGRPVVTLSGAAQQRADALGVTTIHASITHDTDWSAAQIILERAG